MNIRISCVVVMSALLSFSVKASAKENPVDKKPVKARHKTVLEQEIQSKKKADQYPNLINLYNPTYVLPFYQTNEPYQEIYINATPNNQTVKREELKAYFSFLIPIVRHLIEEKPLALNFSYSQLMYWQVYAKSQYFRETNYEPELFIEHYLNRYMAGQIGVDHQSNGRGGDLERSWNRVYAQLKFTGNLWFIKIRAWDLIAQDVSSTIHNPDIAYYLGYENVVLSYKLGKLKTSVEVQNIESGFKRGYVQATISHPLLKSLSIYAQFFNGYGQSLIEYNHKNTGFGIGVSLNDWIF